ncbi:XTP/dITP diphosphatase [Thermodesulfatator autotrophicus]|uniref:dITP/XTP pyrophosphatase n=1 Tax=Thermodesulfatator autotrophicus TaxID=1795632 RepID=A0A177E6Q5_9BACT|nr:XTP/dITP diphosphatase [Thermodesulfatator autotrophicus]OAG27643.1 non-canonical purine NTP pyrophosphatase [Thermodesulfatator autotrophicus]
MPKKILVLATRNPGKVKEIKAYLEDLPVEVKSLADFPGTPEVEETGKTFFENAFKKAKEIAEATGHLALADDSGLEVDALGGAPGVYSARYAGTHGDDQKNIEKLLQELEGVPLDKRTARFKCVMVVYHPSGKWFSAEGVWEGLISLEPRGEKGFGYDPIFLIPELGKTAAELPIEEKNKLSHRGKALAEVKAKLPSFLKEIE